MIIAIVSKQRQRVKVRLGFGRNRALGIADLNLVRSNRQRIAVIQQHLAAAHQFATVVDHRNHAPLVCQTAVAVGGHVHQRLQAGNGTIGVRQHQVIVNATANRAARRYKITGRHRSVGLIL